MKFSAEEIKDIHDQILAGEFRVHLIRSKAGSVVARLWHPEGAMICHARRDTGDRAAAALAAVITLFLGDELKALSLRETAKGSTLDGACGLPGMIKILEAMGFKNARVLPTSRVSDLVLGNYSPPTSP